jgi:hypothetical protein
MNRRSFFKMFGGAIAAAVLPLGALALPKRTLELVKPARIEAVDVSFTTADMSLSLDDFEERIFAPIAARMARIISDNIDTELMRLVK